jgi:hypothetical protein
VRPSGRRIIEFFERSPKHVGALLPRTAENRTNAMPALLARIVRLDPNNFGGTQPLARLLSTAVCCRSEHHAPQCCADRPDRRYEDVVDQQEASVRRILAFHRRAARVFGL